MDTEALKQIIKDFCAFIAIMVFIAAILAIEGAIKL